MNSIIGGLMGAVLTIAGSYQAIAATNVVCPSKLLDQPHILRDEAGWKPVTKAEEKALNNVGIYLERPTDESLGAQVPETNLFQRTRHDHWYLLRAPGDRYWLGCHYANTTAYLVQELGSDVQSCDVEYELLPTGRPLRVKSVSCR